MIRPIGLRTKINPYYTPIQSSKYEKDNTDETDSVESIDDKDSKYYLKIRKNNMNLLKKLNMDETKQLNDPIAEFIKKDQKRIRKIDYLLNNE